MKTLLIDPVSSPPEVLDLSSGSSDAEADSGHPGVAASWWARRWYWGKYPCYRLCHHRLCVSGNHLSD